MNLYALLDVPTTATKQEIEKAYRKKAMKMHPDHGGDKETFKQLTLAYSVLKDPDKRNHYDQTGQTHSQPSPEESALRQLIIQAFVQSDKPINLIIRKLKEQQQDLDNRRDKIITSKEILIRRLKNFKSKHTNTVIEETIEASIMEAEQAYTDITKSLDYLHDVIKEFDKFKEPKDTPTNKYDVRDFMEFMSKNYYVE